jgi:MOSC domain-containing protein YiiM
MEGIIKAIYISPVAGGKMQEQQQIMALKGLGLEGDRYASAQGSFNKAKPGIRQVTLVNAIFFPGSGFEFADSRRNLFVEGIELMWLIGREFKIGDALFNGVKYCDPCLRPSKLAGKGSSFKETFFDRGGLIAEVIEGGLIKVGDKIVPPPKNY